MISKIWKLVSIFFLLPFALLGQECELPVVIEYTNTTTQSTTIHWLDFNDNTSYFEIELGLIGFDRKFESTTPNIVANEFQQTNLDAGTRYEFYIRAICPNGSSEWNGPYFFNTHIDNNRSCQIVLPIDDNNCPSINSYPIQLDVNPNYILGKDIFITSVDMIIEHSWPSDLSMKLLAPNGSFISLYRNRGINTDNLGIPSDLSCENALSLSDNACKNIASDQPPFVGNFKAEQELSIFHDGETKANGVWQLEICDRANGDIGTLNYIKINTTQIPCQLPEAIFLSDIDGDKATVSWNSNSSCLDVKLSYGPAGFAQGQANIDFVVCDKNEFTIKDLIPDTEYEIRIEAVCQSNVSLAACPIFFRTACAPSSLSTNFDLLSNCIPNCTNRCNLSDSIWHNDVNNSIDWILFSGPTPSLFTGPLSGVGGNGSYIYFESQPEACGTSYSASFESNCLQIGTAGSTCGFSFYYHMFGQDVDSLKLQISTDEGMQWETIWEKHGNQSDRWVFESLSLNDYEGVSGKLRFLATSSGGNLGDIGLDQIKLFGSQLNQALFSFYQDFDGDNYGDPDENILICQSNAPLGFVRNDLDCNDTQSNINPGAPEIDCNLIDENCNGIIDDNANNGLRITVLQVVNPSCEGIKDGSISVNAIGGSGSYSYQWSNGESGPTIGNLDNDIYQCTVTDSDQCRAVSDFIKVEATNNLNFVINNITKPSCLGIADGSIEIIVGGGQAPYAITWSNGDEGSNVDKLLEGFYDFSIIDNNGCQLNSDSIFLEANIIVIPGIQLQQNVSCFGKSDGSLRANVTGGLAPYSFEWSNGSTNSFINNLRSGYYQLTVEDSQGCMGILTDIEIIEPDSLEIQLNAIEHILCNDFKNGQIDISVSGGNPPYAYFWSDNEFSSDRINISAGSYDLTVTDSKSCIAEIKNISVNASTPIEINIDQIINVNCISSNNGSISVSVAGGKPPYNYQWNTPGDSTIIDSLAVGIYSLTVTDQFNCKSVLNNIRIENLQTPLSLEIEQISINSCYGDSTAAVQVTVLDGQGPYDFNWSVGIKEIKQVATDTLSALKTGDYAVTITDINGCTGVNVFSITAPELIDVNIDISQNVCFGDSLAEIKLEIDGGSPGYEVIWNEGSSALHLIDLPNGIYEASITDLNDCTFLTQEIEINSPEALEIDILNVGEIQNNTDGSITIIPSGGIKPYSYNWSDPISDLKDSTAINLSSGWYGVTITDFNSCNIDTLIFVDQTNSTIELSDSKTLIYPNPSGDFLHIHTDWGQIKALDVISISGKRKPVSWNHLDGTKVLLDLTNLSSGTYLLRLDTDNKIITKRFIKI